jgi:hypothetical protein
MKHTAAASGCPKKGGGHRSPIGLAAIGLFVAAVIGVVSVAIRREERNFTLIGRAPDNVARAGRWLNGVYVRVPRRTAPDRQATLV